MRKKVMFISILSIFAVAIIITIVILFMPCNHQWINATCTVAKTCSKCQEVEGEPLGHNWNEATCETPKTCKTCSKKEGESLGHNWKKATCQNPKKCSVCGKTEGAVSGHYYVKDSSFGPFKICAYCDKYKPNVRCPKCNWSTFRTGVGIEGITCPDCGYKVL